MLQEFPNLIKAFQDKKVNHIEGETIYIELGFKKGATANITISNQLKQRIRIFEVNIDKNIYIFDDSKTISVENQVAEKTPLESALTKFKNKIIKKKKYINDLQLGLIVVNVLEECQRQISLNQKKC